MFDGKDGIGLFVGIFFKIFENIFISSSDLVFVEVVVR